MHQLHCSFGLPAISIENKAQLTLQQVLLLCTVTECQPATGKLQPRCGGENEATAWQ
jgi:hypothetical protein